MEDRKMDYQKLDRYNLGIRSAGLEEKSVD